MSSRAMDKGLDELTQAPDALRNALEPGDAVTLMLVLVQLTGDESWLEAAAPHINGPLDYQQDLPPALAAAIRDRLCEVLIDQARTDDPLPDVPDGEPLRRMLSTAAGEPVSADYCELMHEELATRDERSRQVDWRDKPSQAVLNNFQVAIIGAGVSGLCAAIHLQQLGIPFTIYEKNRQVGGTWLENRYPGCGVDTPNHFYSFSFAPNPDWSHFFAKRDELWNYLDDIADRYDLKRRIRFGVEVSEARYDETDCNWSLWLTEHGQAQETVRARAVISAVGVLNRAKLPDIPGRDAFAGAAMHTAQWQEDFDWRGKHIALIGTGASGQQVAPRIAAEAASVTVYQRSPHWVVPNPNYFAEVGEGKQWLLANIPYYERWYRFQLFWSFADGLFPALQVDPDWESPARSVNQTNDRHRQFMERYIRQEIGDRPALLEKVIPDYPPYGKRILIDNHWYRMLLRDNVELVTDDIEGIEADGIRCADGSKRQHDAIIYATGFHAARMLGPMRVTGRAGRELSAFWEQDNARAYKGSTVPGFPNFFILTGPNTGLAHGGNQIFMSECQVHYVMLALRELLERGAAALDVKRPVYESFNAQIDERHEHMVWTHKGMSNWYRNSHGRVFAISPWRLVEFWQMTRDFDAEAYDFEPLETARASA